MPETSNQAPNESAISIKTEYFALGGFILFAGFYMLTATGIGIDPSSLVAASSRTAPITMVTPNGGENWMASTTQNITWSGGDRDWVVSLYLINGERTKTVSMITRSTSNTGSYSWHIPANIPAGQYYVRIGCENCKPSVKNRVDFSDKPFVVTVEPDAPFRVESSEVSVIEVRQGDPDNFVAKLHFRVTALDRDVWIARDVTYGEKPALGRVTWGLASGSTVNVIYPAGVMSSLILDSGDSESGYKVAAGSSREFSLSTTGAASATGVLSVQIAGIGYDTDADLNSGGLRYIGEGLGSLKTEFVNVVNFN